VREDRLSVTAEATQVSSAEKLAHGEKRRSVGAVPRSYTATVSGSGGTLDPFVLKGRRLTPIRANRPSTVGTAARDARGRAGAHCSNDLQVDGRPRRH